MGVMKQNMEITTSVDLGLQVSGLVEIGFRVDGAVKCHYFLL